MLCWSFPRWASYVWMKNKSTITKKDFSSLCTQLHKWNDVITLYHESSLMLDHLTLNIFNELPIVFFGPLCLLLFNYPPSSLLALPMLLLVFAKCTQTTYDTTLPFFFNGSYPSSLFNDLISDPNLCCVTIIYINILIFTTADLLLLPLY